MGNALYLGLRIDVDTLRGTRHGVPALVSLLKRYNIRASFFFSVGPDNMGRNIWRLLKPAFLIKMLRSNAPGLYGWDILLMGTCWPGPRIGNRCRDIIRKTSEEGHEIGLHAWDHYAWQNHILSHDTPKVREKLALGFNALTDIIGRQPTCSAAPGWITGDAVLKAKESFPFRYNSDCRGTHPFRPFVDGRVLTPQIPVTLPTYDEIIGKNGITRETYNDHLLSLISKDGLNVLTIHAEVEGILCLDLFEDFIQSCIGRGIEIGPLSRCLGSENIEAVSCVEQTPIPGREGLVAVQKPCRQDHAR